MHGSWLDGTEKTSGGKRQPLALLWVASRASQGGGRQRPATSAPAAQLGVDVEVVHAADVALDVVGPVELLGAEEAGELAPDGPVQQLVPLEVGLVGKAVQADGAHDALERQGGRLHGRRVQLVAQLRVAGLGSLERRRGRVVLRVYWHGHLVHGQVCGHVVGKVGRRPVNVGRSCHVAAKFFFFRGFLLFRVVPVRVNLLFLFFFVQPKL